MPTTGQVLTWNATNAGTPSDPNGEWASPAGGYGESCIRQHTTARGPLLLVQFDGDFNDSSGNGYHLAAVSSSIFAPIFPGSTIRGLYLYASGATRAARTPALDILGAITVEYLAYSQDRRTLQEYWFSYAGAGEAENDNYLWSLYQDAPSNYGCFTEYGAGLNEDTKGTVPGGGVGQLVHMAVTRAADGVSWKVYENGILLDSFAAANAPTVGAAPSQVLYVGRDIGGQSVNYAVIASFCVINSELTAAQVREDAVWCLPWLGV